MPLLFNDQQLTGYEKYVKDLEPRGKDKELTFQLTNAQPFRVLGSKGWQHKSGGEKRIYAFDTVTLPEYTDAQGKVHKNVTGVLQYYATKQSVPGRNGGIVDNLEPKYIVFDNHVRRVNAVTQKDLLFFMQMHSENKGNAAWSNKKPKFHLVEQNVGNAQKVSTTNEKILAFNKIAELKEKQPSRLRQVYEACGHSDWEIHIPKDKRLNEHWDNILAPLYNIAESTPRKILDLINDTDLDIHAKITIALEAGLITYTAGAFAWGEQVKADAKSRKIAKAPAGKQDDDTARAWFANWLKGDGSGVMEELNIELDALKLRA